MRDQNFKELRQNYVSQVCTINIDNDYLYKFGSNNFMQMYVADFSYFYQSKYTLKWTVSHFNVIQYFRIDEKTFKNSNFVHENMKKWSKKHPQNTLKSTAPIWVLGVPTLYIHISELNTCELCFVMYQGSRLFPHWFCTVLLHRRLCRASVALGMMFLFYAALACRLDKNLEYNCHSLF